MNTVIFRDFEERDIDFVYKCKNDEKLNSLIVGEYHPFTYEEAAEWVHGCMGEHETFKFWAVCTNDEEKRIIGWAALSKIDKENRSAKFHSIVIGDQMYRFGQAYIETYLFVFKYVFEHLGLNRLYGSAIIEHKLSNTMAEVMFQKEEGVLRQAVFKNGCFHDEAVCAILKEEYFNHKQNGDFEMPSILKRVLQVKRKHKNISED